MKKVFILSALLFTSACAKVNDRASNTDTSSSTASLGGTASTSTEIRQCSEELGGVTQGKLGAFFGRPVSNLEGAVTYCLNLSGNGTNVKGSTFRIEYEDDYGVRAYKTDESNVFGGKINIDSSGNTTVDVIFIDDAGFVQVKGSAPNSGTFTGTVKFYNFPSYEDALSDQITEAQQKCKDGTYTVAQCLGYNFPMTYWWNETYVTPSQQMMNQAEEILGNTNKTTQLGTISAQLSAIWSN